MGTKAEDFCNSCKDDGLDAKKAIEKALESGVGVEGDFSHVIGGAYHTRVTFSDGSDIYFGDDVYNADTNLMF